MDLTVRSISVQKHWQRWIKLTIAVSALAVLSSYMPLPSLIDQIKTLGELRVGSIDHRRFRPAATLSL